MTSKNENTPKNEKKWTPEFMEQFAREWLKHKLLLPNPQTDGMTLKGIRRQKAADRREMYSALGISKCYTWTYQFLRQYERMLAKLFTSVRAKTNEEALAAVPPWVRDFELHFNLIPKVLEEVRISTATDKSLLLLNMIRAMWTELRDKGSQGHKLMFWTRAINAAAKECAFPTLLVKRTWYSVKRVAMQKLRLLQSTGDKVPAGSPINLTPAEWLAVDLILIVEPQETLLDQDSLKDYDQLAILTTMFSLAQMYQLDECLLGTAKDSKKRWQNATQVYIHRGFSSSIVVLQRRWYEMVQLSRDKLATFHRTRSDVPPLCHQLALRFPQLLTMPLPSWWELVRARRIVFPDYADEHTQHTPSELAAADVVIPHDDGPKDDDIILIEKDIETIDLDGLDSNDEDRLIIDERIKIDRKKLQLRKRQIKQEIDTIQLEKKLLQEKKQEICTKLDSELDCQLKDIQENQDNIKSQSSNDNSTIDSSSFKSSRNKKSINYSEIDLTESDSLDESTEADQGVDILKTEIDITEHNILDTNLTSELEVVVDPISKITEESSDSISNREIMNSDNIAPKKSHPTEACFSELSNIAVFEELDPSNVEAKIIFSDEEDDGNNIELLNPSIYDKDTHFTNQETNVPKRQDELMDKQIVVKTEVTSTDLTENETRLNNNIQIHQTVSIINLDADSSDFETSSSKVKTENESLRIEKVIDEPNSNKSTNIVIPSLSKKKRIGPKSFMQKCQDEEISKKICLEPNTTTIFFKSGQKLTFESEENDSTALESVENEVSNKVVSDSDKNNENVETICKKEVTSDEEDSNLVIVENIEQPEIKKESSLGNNKHGISSKLCFEKEIVDDEITCNKESKASNLDVNKTVDNTLSSYIETIPNKARDIELDGDKSKNIDNAIANEKSHERFSSEYDNTQIDDIKPIIPMEIDEAIIADNNKNDTEGTDTYSYSKITLKSEDTESYIVEQDRSDSRTDCQSNNDENDDAPSNVDIDKLLMPVQIPLYKIDQFSFWNKHAKENRIDLSKIKQNANPVKPRRLKPGLRPDWAKPVKRLNRSCIQSDLMKNPDFNVGLKKLDAEFIMKNAYVMANILKPVTIDVERLPQEVIERYLESQNSSDQDQDPRPRKKVELADIEEVRRINRRLLTAQVRPIVATRTIESGSESESDVSIVMDLPAEPRNQSVDNPADSNTLTQQELDAVLKKLTRNEKSRSRNIRKPREHCCPARRHINYNRARARTAARAGRKSQTVLNLHARSGEEHAKLKCDCCCLNALRGMEMNKLRLSHDQRALDRDLRKLVQNVHKHESFQHPISEDAPIEPSSAPQDFPVDSDEEVPLVNENRKDKERRILKRKREQEQKQRKIARLKKQKNIEEIITAEERQRTEENDYDEWMRQRNICAKYFTISSTGTTTTSERPKTMVTFKPIGPNKTSTCTKSQLTEEQVKLNEHFLKSDKADEMIDKCEKAAANKTLCNTENKEINEPIIIPDEEVNINNSEENSKQNEKTDGNVKGNYVTEEHNYMKLPLPISIQQPLPKTPMLTILPMTSQQYDLADEDPMTIILPDTQKPPPTQTETPTSILEDLCEVVKLTDEKKNTAEPDTIPRYIIKTSTAANGQPPTIELQLDSSRDTSEQGQIETQANQTAQASVSETKANQVPLECQAGQTDESSNQSKRIKQHIVTHVSGKPDSQATRYWNSAITQPQIKTLIETAQANPGLKFMKVLLSPNNSETVLATCIANKQDPNQTTLRLITQRSNTLAKSPLFTPDCIDLTENDTPAEPVSKPGVSGQPINQPEQTIAHVSQLVRSLGKPVPVGGQVNQVDETLGQPVQTVGQVNQLVQPLGQPVLTIGKVNQLGKMLSQPAKVVRQANQIVKPIGPPVKVGTRVARATIPISELIKQVNQPVKTFRHASNLVKTYTHQQAQKPRLIIVGSTDAGKVTITTSSNTNTQKSNEKVLNKYLNMTQRSRDLTKALPSWILNTNQTIETENVIVIKDDTDEKVNENSDKISMPLISDAVEDSDKPSTSIISETSDCNKPTTSEMTETSDCNKPSTSKMTETSDCNKPSTSKMTETSDCNKPSTSKMTETSDCNKPSTSKMTETSDCNKPSTSKMTETSDCNKPSTSKMIETSDCNKPSTSKMTEISDSNNPSFITTSIRIIKSSIRSESSGKSMVPRLTANELAQSLLGVKVQYATTPLQQCQHMTAAKAPIRKKRFRMRDLSYATPIYIEDLVEHIKNAKTPLSEVQILSVNTTKPLLKLRFRYIIVTERIEAGKCLPAFWTLNPPLHFSQIHFSRFANSPSKVKKLITNEVDKRNVSVEANATDNNCDTVKLKVKAFAKLPGTENALALNENLEIDMKDQSRDKPLDTMLVGAQDIMYLDNKCYKKLSDKPLIYAQVFSVISELPVVEDLAVQNTPLFLLNTLGGQRLMPILRREVSKEERRFINLICPGAEDAMKDLVTMMNSSVNEFGFPRRVRQGVTFTSLDGDITAVEAGASDVRAATAGASDVIQIDTDDET